MFLDSEFGVLGSSRAIGSCRLPWNPVLFCLSEKPFPFCIPSYQLTTYIDCAVEFIVELQTIQCFLCHCCYYYYDILFILRGEGKERGREISMCERYIDWLPLSCPQLGGPSLQPRHVPWWDLNWQPLVLQAGTQSTEPHLPGLIFLITFYWLCY